MASSSTMYLMEMTRSRMPTCQRSVILFALILTRSQQLWSRVRSSNLYGVSSITACSTSWMMHCDPDLLSPFLAQVDACILRCAQAALGCSLQGPKAALARARIRLPIRNKGGGLPCFVDSAPAFFVGAVLRSIPSFIDRRRNGVLLPGLYNNSLSGLFGMGSFDDGLLDFTTFTDPATASPLAESFTSAWNSLRMVTMEGVLSEPVERASGTQHKLSELLHNANLEGLQSVLNGGVVYSLRERILFGQVDDFSSIFLKVLPDTTGKCSPLEWVEIASQYFFLPSSTISSFRCWTTHNGAKREEWCSSHL